MRTEVYDSPWLPLTCGMPILRALSDIGEKGAASLAALNEEYVCSSDSKTVLKMPARKIDLTRYSQNSFDSTMDNSLLDKLPGELRNRIYAYVLSSWGITFVSFLPRYRVAGPKPSHHDLRIEAGAHTHPQSRHLLALTHTCRQIRQETQGLFFSLNKIRFPVSLVPRITFPEFCNKTSPPIAAAPAMRAWLEARNAEDIAALREITIDAGRLHDHGVRGPTFGDDRIELARACRALHDELQSFAVLNGLPISILVEFRLLIKRPRCEATSRMSLPLLGNADAMRTAVPKAVTVRASREAENDRYCRREMERFVEMLIKELKLE